MVSKTKTPRGRAAYSHAGVSRAQMTARDLTVVDAKDGDHDRGDPRCCWSQKSAEG